MLHQSYLDHSIIPACLIITFILITTLSICCCDSAVLIGPTLLMLLHSQLCGANKPCHATVAWVPFLSPSPPPLLCNLSDTHLCVQAYRKLNYLYIKFLLILLFTCFLIICCVIHTPAYVFDQDAASELVAELQGLPDFIIGNYSDGNLVSSLLAHKMGVTQVSKLSGILIMQMGRSNYYLLRMQSNCYKLWYV